MNEYGIEEDMRNPLTGKRDYKELYTRELEFGNKMWQQNLELRFRLGEAITRLNQEIVNLNDMLRNYSRVDSLVHETTQRVNSSTNDANKIRDVPPAAGYDI